MANQDHLSKLKEGVAVWNQWRTEHAGIHPDLSATNLSAANLNGADLHDANLSATNLINADLNAANIDNAHLHYADLSHADLSYTRLSHAHLYRANLINADLRAANLINADLRAANLINADLRAANLINADLRAANLRNARLHNADLSRADLSRADLSHANLRSTHLNGANLSDAYLSDAYLNGANLSNTELSSADLSNATCWETTFANVDLQTVKGLESVRHNGPSSIDISTLYRSSGNISEAFLKGAGIDDTFITYIHSLTAKPIQYYSCFITYSSKDETFAKRLYADLQSQNVRCWFAPEDLKIGDHYHQHIDDSIRIYDKLILILSEHAVQSAWVEREVVAAREKEDHKQQQVLFPIRLDDAVMITPKAWAADVRRRWHIGDLTRWKEHDAYQLAFNRLLRDLKAQSQ